MIKEVVKLFWCDVRVACISHEWYTCGDNKAYDALRDYVDNNANDRHALTAENYTDVLEYVARDIKAHSDTDYDYMDIMNVLSLKCIRYFEEC